MPQRMIYHPMIGISIVKNSVRDSNPQTLQVFGGMTGLRPVLLNYPAKYLFAGFVTQ